MRSNIRVDVEPQSDDTFRVLTVSGGCGWGIGIDYQTERAAEFAAAALRKSLAMDGQVDYEPEDVKP